jgi:malate synthase
VDDELAVQAGPQLVVPILNARYALNAANARWGSLYDALYGTDAIPRTDGAEKGKGYNPVRGAKVIEFARHVLDQHRAAGNRLAQGRHRLPRGRRPAGGGPEERQHHGPEEPAVRRLPGRRRAPTSVLLQHNGLHLDIQIDRSTPIGKTDAAGVATWCWKRPCPPSWTWKTRWPPWTPRTRCWATATGWAS